MEKDLKGLVRGFIFLLVVLTALVYEERLVTISNVTPYIFSED